jgi:sec-independent protein translocase protein TatB
VLDLGIDKLALIGAVALIVIGPEKLPRVARTVGTLVGRAQRYVADVKAEVNRSIELEELKKMKTQFETAARDVESHVSQTIHQTTSELEQTWQQPGDTDYTATITTPPPAYKPPKKNWRVKRSAMPQWYKRRAGVRVHAQSGAARVARFRPPHLR